MNYHLKTGYKNIKKTILLSVVIGSVCYLFAILLFPNTQITQKLTGVISALISLILLGRTIIVRHEIRKNNVIIVEFLLRPKHKVIFGHDKVKKIEYFETNLGRYGRYTKGVIIFNEKKTKRPSLLKDLLESELTWFRVR